MTLAEQVVQADEAISLFEAMESLSAKRQLKSDPVPREVLEQLVYYATRAGSGGNRQPWAFVVVTDRAKIQAIGRLYAELERKADGPEAANDPVAQQVAQSSDYLREHMGDVPALVLVCHAEPRPDDPARLIPRYGSIFPAVQNLMLAARAFGLGTVLTTRHRARDTEVKTLLGIPDHVETVCLLPIGYPARPFARIKNRKDPAEVTHWDAW